MKRTPKTLLPQRSYRTTRTNSKEFESVLAMVNGALPIHRDQPNYLEVERTEARKTLDKIITYCDRLESALIDGVDQGRKIPKSERIKWALVNIAHREFYKAFDSICDSLSKQDFRIIVKVRRDRPGTDVRIADTWKANKVPPADELFRAQSLFILPSPSHGGHRGIQFLWNFLHRIIEIDDLRRIRKCSGFLHGDPDKSPPFYFLRKNVRREERYFCSNQCRSHYNYNKESKEVKDYGRQRKKKGR